MFFLLICSQNFCCVLPFYVIYNKQHKTVAHKGKNMFDLDSAIRSVGPNLQESLKRMNEITIDESSKTQGFMYISRGFESNRTFLDSVFGVGNTRLTWTFDADEFIDIDPTDCEWYYRTVQELDNMAFYLDNYILGTCKKRGNSDNRVYKIGKVLTKAGVDKNIINGFANSKLRSSSNKKKLSVTLSRNTLDLVLMSTGRGWTSCMSMERGNRTYVASDVINDTLIAYVHDPEDVDIRNPSGRILFKKYGSFNAKTMKMVSFYQNEGCSYGDIRRNLLSEIYKITYLINDVMLANTEEKKIKGELAPGCYADNLSNVEYYINATNITIDDILSENWDRSVITQVLHKVSDHTPYVSNKRISNYLSSSKITFSKDVVRALIKMRSIEKISSTFDEEKWRVFDEVAIEELDSNLTYNLFAYLSPYKKGHGEGLLCKRLEDTVFQRLEDFFRGKAEIFRESDITEDFIVYFFDQLSNRYGDSEFSEEECEVMRLISKKRMPNNVAQRFRGYSYQFNSKVYEHITSLSTLISIYTDIRGSDEEKIKQAENIIKKRIMDLLPENNTGYDDSDLIINIESKFRTVVAYTGENSSPVTIKIEDDFVCVI